MGEFLSELLEDLVPIEGRSTTYGSSVHPTVSSGWQTSQL